MKKMSLNNKDSINTLVNRFLFKYRITPHTGSNQSPSELLMNRKLTSALDKLKPNHSRKERLISEKMIASRESHSFKKFDGEQV